MADIDDLEDTAPTPDGPNEPIDADFEPAPTRSPKRLKSPRKGPGWFGVAIASLMATGAGGAIGIALDGTSATSSPVETAEIVDIRSAQEDMDISLNKLARNVAESENRLQEQMKALLAGDGDREGLQALVRELDTVSQRLDEAMVTGSAGGAAPDALAALGLRLDALETPGGNDGKASPREVTRALAALTKRLDRIEAAQKEIVIGLETRAEAMKTVTDRMTDLEFAGTGEAGGGRVAGQAVETLQDDLETLKAEMATLRADQAQSAETALSDIEQYQNALADMQATGRDADNQAAAASLNTTKAVLALSAIEAAARRGRSFESEFERLEAALPRDRSVARLAPIAAQGAPTQAELRTRFETAHEAAMQALRPASRKSGWGWVDDVFGDAVTYRRNDGSDASPAHWLDLARKTLAEDDLAAALEAAKKLDGKAGKAMADWIDDAEQRITLEEGLERLRVRLAGGE